MTQQRQGPLSGVRVLEIAGIGPAPFCGMLLADLGADVVVIDRLDSGDGQIDLAQHDIPKRGKRSVVADLKTPQGMAAVLDLVEHADALIEGMRPGVMERLGLGPEVCLQRNPRLVYGRMTGWGQTGPLAHAAGHDLNYIALSGALWYSGQPGETPMTPPSLVGDIGGGALYLAVGLLAGIMHARGSGAGQVVDAAIVDGSAHMMSLLLALQAAGQFTTARGQSLLDGPHWYNTYRCADGGMISVGSMEPKFYRLLREKLGQADDPAFNDAHDRRAWPVLRQRFAQIFASRTRDEWCALLEGTDACFAPVLSPEEASAHPHMQAREAYTRESGVLQPNPAPRFSLTPAHGPRAIPRRGEHTQTVLSDWAAGSQAGLQPRSSSPVEHIPLTQGRLMNKDVSSLFLSEQQILIRDTARRVAREIVAPTAAQRDLDSAWPHKELRDLAELGFLGMLIPEEYGGTQAGVLDFCLAQHEFAAVDAGLATILHVHNFTAMCIAENGTDDQKRRFLPDMASGKAIGAFLLSEPHAGSDTAALRSSAVRDGDHYVLNGSKQFISNGSEAGVGIAFAITDKAAGKRGATTFIVDTSKPGYVTTRVESKLGQHTAHTAQITLDNYRAPASDMLGAEGDGYRTVMGGLSDGRIGIAFIAAGAARAALDAAVKYANEREAYGAPIARLQGVAFDLADMAAQVDVAFQYCIHAARLRDAGVDCVKEASIAKLFASEIAEKVCSTALQIHGGYGYLCDFPVERYLRDVRVCKIYEGTSHIQKLIISRCIA